MTKEDALYYEVGASWWARHVSWKWAQAMTSRYYAWKVNRKWARHLTFNAAVRRNPDLSR